MSDDLQKALAERNARLLALDIAWTRQQLTTDMGAPDDAQLLLAMHKARVECRGLPDEPRRESARWLLERGYSRFTGEKPDPENLPT